MYAGCLCLSTNVYIAGEDKELRKSFSNAVTRLLSVCSFVAGLNRRRSRLFVNKTARLRTYLLQKSGTRRRSTPIFLIGKSRKAFLFVVRYKYFCGIIVTWKNI
jgi:hypothetical protein